MRRLIAVALLLAAVFGLGAFVFRLLADLEEQIVGVHAEVGFDEAQLPLEDRYLDTLAAEDARWQ